MEMKNPPHPGELIGDTLDELDRLRQRLADAGSLVGASDHGTTKALYAKDPDGIEFEVCWLVPKDRLDGHELQGVAALDLEGELARYGPATVGGLGISWPA